MSKSVLIDVDAVAQWHGSAISASALERLRGADRIVFDRSESVSGTPPEGHIWMGYIRYDAGRTYELRVPMHAIIFPKE